VHGDGVEAVVDRDVAGERIIDAFLRLDRDDRPSAVMAVAHSIVWTPILAPQSTAITPSPW
jgi:hypothetical protein